MNAHNFLLKKIKLFFKLFHFIMEMAYEGLLIDMGRQQKSLFLSMDIKITNHYIRSK